METDKLLENQFKTLPIALQQALTETPWLDTVKTIASENSLDEENAESLLAETTLVLYGFEDSDNYLENIKKELNVDQAKAELIADSISTRIFEVILNKVTELNTKTIPSNQTALEIPPNNLPELEPENDLVVKEPARDVPPPAPVVPATNPQAPARTFTLIQPGKAPEVTEIPKASGQTETKPPEPQAPIIKGYPKGMDPYREPIE